VRILAGRYGSAYSPPGSRVFNRVNAPDSGGTPNGQRVQGADEKSRYQIVGKASHASTLAVSGVVQRC
jgi:hypothetical protein